jgi:signal transduction histidine kinase
MSAAKATEPVRNSAKTIEEKVAVLLAQAESLHKEKPTEQEEALALCDDAYNLALDRHYEQGKADALRRKGVILFHIDDHKEALDCFLREEKIRRKIGTPQEIATVLHAVGNCYLTLNNFQKAMLLFLESVALRETLGDKQGLASSFNNLGYLHEKIGNNAESLEYYLRSLKIREELGEKLEIAGAFNGVGTAYNNVRDYQTALAFYEKSLTFYEDLGEREGCGMVYGNIGIVWGKLGRYEEALGAHLESKRLFEETDRTYHLAMTFACIGDAYFNLKMETEALTFFEEGLALAKKTGHIQVEVEILINLSKILLRRNEADDALHYLRNALRISKKSGLKRSMLEVYRQMVAVYRHKKDFATALDAFESLYELEKELFNEDSASKVRNMQSTYEIEQTRRETEFVKKKNTELTEANRLKTELLGIAAHDLKNPLQSILGFSKLLQERIKYDERSVMYCKRIESGSERMLSIITSILQDAAISNGKLKLVVGEMNLTAVLKNIIDQNKPKADEKKQTVTLVADEQLMMHGDSRYIAEIAENLISNAIKYSPKSTRITVSIMAHEIKNDASLASQPVIRMTVKDEGLGLSDEDKTKLFGKFQKLSSKPTGGETSTGLGLAIVKQLVELHNGKIWAESPGKDLGSTFFVEFPVRFS